MKTIEELRIEIEAVELAIEDAFFTAEVIDLKRRLDGLQQELHNRENE